MRSPTKPRGSEGRLTEESLDDPSFGAVEDPARSVLAHAERFGEFRERTLARTLVVPALDRLDDSNRDATLVDPNDPDAPHLFLVGDTYTVLLSGEDTAD